MYDDGRPAPDSRASSSTRARSAGVKRTVNLEVRVRRSDAQGFSDMPPGYTLSDSSVRHSWSTKTSDARGRVGTFGDIPPPIVLL